MRIVKTTLIVAWQANASPHRPDGLTAPQLALVLMGFGVLTALWAIKCLVFGPPPSG